MTLRRFLAGALAVALAFAPAPAAFAAQQTINVGTTANDGTGDTLRAAFTKVNANDTELYGRAFDTEITALAGTTSAANKLFYFTGSGTGSVADLSAFMRGTFASADAAAARTAFGVAIGTNVQAYDADLTTYAGITPSANVQTLLGSADYAAFRSNLSLGTFATQDFATPPAIGGTTPAAGTFSTLTATSTLTTNVTGSTQCLHVNSSGVISGTGGDCATAAGVTDGDKGDVVVSSTATVWTLDMPLTPGGRLTLTSNTPVLAADATAQGTVYYSPYITARLPNYDGTNWKMWNFSQLSLSLNSTDNTATNLYDIFVFNASGTLTLGTGPAWSSGTSRGTGAGTTELELKDGIWTNKVSITLKAGGSTVGTPSANQATYLGTAYMTANGQTGMAFKPASASGGTNNILGLFNAYNRVQVKATNRDIGSTWTKTNNTWAALNAGGTGSGLNNRVSYVDGLQQIQPVGTATALIFTTANAASAAIGMVLDSTSATPGQYSRGQTNGASNTSVTIISREAFLPQLGFHYLQAMQANLGNTGTASYVGSPDEQIIVELEM